MNEPSFTVVCHINGQLITIPEDMFTVTQRSAIKHILSRIGKDPVPPAEREPQTSLVVVGTPPPAAMDVHASIVARRAESKAKGYTGDACNKCFMFTLKASGHCFVCDSCGETTGCS